MSDVTHSATEIKDGRNEKLAVHGGEPVRTARMPPRLALGDEEVRMVQEVLAYYREHEVDPGYQGPFEKLYTDRFCEIMGGGYADAVATGTASLFVALAALELPKGSEVMISPITDPGSLSAIILNGLKPKLCDSLPNSYNIGVEQVVSRIGPNTSAICVVHAAGQACEIDKITAACHERGVKVLEDPSQAHGAKIRGRPVGSFGDIAAFSTMYRKAHMTGASGGLIYCRDLDLYRKVLAHADRGKPRWQENFSDRDPSTYLFPALNHHTDEISCGIGIASLGRLESTITRRMSYVTDVIAGLAEHARICRAYPMSPNDSPFFFPIIVDVDRIKCSKIEFAEAVLKEGIDLNPHYRFVVDEWPWVQPYLADDYKTENARSIRDRTFCLYVNENYGEAEANDTVEAILKVERHFGKFD
jgi:dTDP-4-amino-4,6-dideoxygalactose transaminase